MGGHKLVRQLLARHKVAAHESSTRDCCRLSPPTTTIGTSKRTMATSSTSSAASPASMYGGSGVHRLRPVTMASFVAPAMVDVSMDRTAAGHVGEASAIDSVTTR